jgi:hypothetical protein
MRPAAINHRRRKHALAVVGCPRQRRPQHCGPVLSGRCTHQPFRLRTRSATPRRRLDCDSAMCPNDDLGRLPVAAFFLAGFRGVDQVYPAGVPTEPPFGWFHFDFDSAATPMAAFSLERNRKSRIRSVARTILPSPKCPARALLSRYRRHTGRPFSWLSAIETGGPPQIGGIRIRPACATVAA